MRLYEMLMITWENRIKFRVRCASYKIQDDGSLLTTDVHMKMAGPAGESDWVDMGADMIFFRGKVGLLDIKFLWAEHDPVTDCGPDAEDAAF